MRDCQDGNFIPFRGRKQDEGSGSTRLGAPRCFSNGLLIQSCTQEHFKTSIFSQKWLGFRRGWIGGLRLGIKRPSRGL